MTTEQRRDSLGIPYDHMWVDSNGTNHYSLTRALGGGRGSSAWSDEHDCNPVCGHHLAWRCASCSVCTECDGCYCGENSDGY
jgi:hypothetical protein